MNPHHKIKRNVVIYISGVLLLSLIGGVVTATVSEAGGLLLVLSPILLMGLRVFSAAMVGKMRGSA